MFKQSDRLTRGKRLDTLSLDGDHLPDSGDMDPSEVVSAERRRRQVHEAIRRLREPERTAVMLYYVSDYSQKEVSEFLDVPISTVKKRLHDARGHLKTEMQRMLRDSIERERPSNDTGFSAKVEFFIALKSGDLSAVQSLLDRHPDLVHARTEWAVASEGHYWPLGVTALHWAVGSGNEPLATLLLSAGADVEGGEGGRMTPLHRAVLMGQRPMVDLLLDRQANVVARTAVGHTPLHLAAIRNDPDLAGRLVDRGADTEARDNKDRSPLDWAVQMGHEGVANRLSGRPDAGSPAASKGIDPAPEPARSVPSGKDVIGRAFDASGELLLGPQLPPETQVIPVDCKEGSARGPVLETGIKIIDVLAPIRRGGHVGIFTPLSGVGLLVALGQIAHNAMRYQDALVVYLGLEEGAYTAEGRLLAWRDEFGPDERLQQTRMVHVFGKGEGGSGEPQRVAETGLAIAESLRDTGNDVLLMVENKVSAAPGVLRYLRSNAGPGLKGSITTLYSGHHSADLIPEPYLGLDGLVTFDRIRASQGLYPAVHPLKSSSVLFDMGLLSPDHARITRAIRGLFRRYEDLHDQFERRGLDGLFYLDDRSTDETTVIRARRLHRFLTQPFFGAEPYTGIKGEYVGLEAGLEGCDRILSGEMDDVAEDSFRFIGGIEHAAAGGLQR